MRLESLAWTCRVSRRFATTSCGLQGLLSAQLHLCRILSRCFSSSSVPKWRRRTTLPNSCSASRSSCARYVARRVRPGAPWCVRSAVLPDDMGEARTGPDRRAEKAHLSSGDGGAARHSAMQTQKVFVFRQSARAPGPDSALSCQGWRRCSYSGKAPEPPAPTLSCVAEGQSCRAAVEQPENFLALPQIPAFAFPPPPSLGVHQPPPPHHLRCQRRMPAFAFPPPPTGRQEP